MRKQERMSVAEMDRVNHLCSLTTGIDRLELSQRERALAYFKYMEREVDADLAPYAARFDDLVREAKTAAVLKRLRECAVAARG